MKNCFYIVHIFCNTLILYKMKWTSFLKLCISVTIQLIWIKFADTIVKLKRNDFVDGILFHLIHIFRTQSVFSNFEHYLKVKNLLYPNQNPVEFNIICRSENKLENKIISLKNIFQFYMRFFRVNKLESIYVEILVKYMKLSIFHEIREI